MSFTALKTIRPFFTDDCGRLLAGGKIYSYEPGTLTPKPTYKDAAGLTVNTNPIILDASGEADIYINSDYRFQIFDRDGVLIDDVDLVAATQRVSSEFVLDASGLTQGQINNNVRLEQGQALTPTAAWPDVLSLINQGGAPSIHDVPVQALLNRIQKLYEDAVLLSSAVADRYTKSEANNLFIENTEKGLANGIATLDANAKVPAGQLQSASTAQTGIVQLVNDLTTGGIDKALTAEQGKALFNMFIGSTTFNSAGDIHFYIPNASVPSKPWIIQIGTRISLSSYVANTEVVATLPVTYPNTYLFTLVVNGDVSAQTNSVIGISQYKTNSAFGWRCNAGGAARMNYLSIGN